MAFQTQQAQLPLRLYFTKKDREINARREYMRRWRSKNKLRYRTAVDVCRNANQQRLRDYKATLACKCGETHPACLEFHHRDPATKKFNVAHGAASSKAWATIQAEIEKCDVLCANCHRKEHFTK